MKRLLLLAILFAPQVAQAASGWLEVDAKFGLDEKQPDPRVGEPFKFIVTARHSAGGIALLPSPLELGDAVAERAEARKHVRTLEGEVEIDRYELELLAFDRGLVTIPAIPLALGSTTAATQAMELSIVSSLEGDELAALNSTQAETIQVLDNLAAQNPPPQRMMVGDYTLFWVLGVLVVLGLAIWIGRIVANRKAAARPAPPPPPPPPAHEVALERLDALRRANHLEQGAYKIFYTELSAIMRTYSGSRWQFDSLDLTVDELTEILRERSTNGLDLTKMTHLLQLADQVKFAKFVPTKQDGDVLLNDAVSLVEATKVRPPKPQGDVS